MGISDKEAFRILELPLGVDKDAICDRYKHMSSKLSASKSPEDKKRLEHVVAAYSQLLPAPFVKNLQNNRSPKGGKNSKNNNHLYCDDSNDSSSENDSVRAPCRNGDSRNTHIIKDEIMDIERDRRKADRRRAKKKRRKEKKKLEKMENKFSGTLEGCQRDDDSDSDEDDEEDNIEEEQGIDPKSAFVAIAGKKISNVPSWKQQEDNKKNNTKINGQEELENQTLDPETRSLQSRQLAIKGNEEANNGQYERAVRLFSDAIRLESNDHRFFGNRSYCYDQLGQYEKALKDADRSIKLAAEWPKGHFRRGRALKGLGKYSEAEIAFQKVLRFDEECEDALTEIVKVRRKRIIEMGFTEPQAKAAIKKYSQVQPALDALLTGEFKGSLDNVFYSDDEETFEEEPLQPPPPPVAADVKMNPRNPEGLTSLWVGNVVPEINEKQLTKVFNKYGTVTSVRLLKEKYCAFVNFSDKAGAGRAMSGLQGFDLGGNKLLIKFPDNPIVNGSSNVVIRKTKPTISKNIPTSNTTSQAANLVLQGAQRSKGPVNGDECYFWRTTGCAFGDACKHKHIPTYKGIDRKPWQK